MNLNITRDLSQQARDGSKSVANSIDCFLSQRQNRELTLYLGSSLLSVKNAISPSIGILPLFTSEYSGSSIKPTMERVASFLESNIGGIKPFMLDSDAHTQGAMLARALPFVIECFGVDYYVTLSSMVLEDTRGLYLYSMKDEVRRMRFSYFGVVDVASFSIYERDYRYLVILAPLKEDSAFVPLPSDIKAATKHMQEDAPCDKSVIDKNHIYIYMQGASRTSHRATLPPKAKKAS